MKSLVKFSFLIAGITFIVGCAAGASAENSVLPFSETDVIAELSKRSRLPVEQLKEMLSNCDANQQSMYFCAYRDYVTVDIQLEQLAAQQETREQSCVPGLAQRKSLWGKHRDERCARSAKREFGGGSMEPTALLMCITDETKRMLEKLNQTSRKKSICSSWL